MKGSTFLRVCFLRYKLCRVGKFKTQLRKTTFTYIHIYVPDTPISYTIACVFVLFTLFRTANMKCVFGFNPT